MAYTDEQREYHRHYYIKRRQRLLDYVGGACVDCGITSGLEFDHVDPSLKSFNIASNITLNEAVKAELDKCVLRCKGCHIEKTRLDRQPFTHGTLYGWQKRKCKCGECLAAKSAYQEARNAKRRKPGGYGPRTKRT